MPAFSRSVADRFARPCASRRRRTSSAYSRVGSRRSHVFLRGKSEQIFEIRAALISLAARLTTQRITEDVTHYMQWSIPEVEQRASADNVGEFLRLVYRLSMFLTESSRNEKLEAMFVSMSRQTLALTHRVLSKPPNRKRWARNWQRLARAIIKGDVDGATGAANQLVLETGQWVEEEARMMDERASRAGLRKQMSLDCGPGQTPPPGRYGASREHRQLFHQDQGMLLNGRDRSPFTKASRDFHDAARHGVRAPANHQLGQPR
ncbi:MAG: FCD domain-containing protein [Gammaproteobacteria bacterium]|nr:FCD domain-containing protein [Gammaproteobacteria bacterium]